MGDYPGEAMRSGEGLAGLNAHAIEAIRADDGRTVGEYADDGRTVDGYAVGGYADDGRTVDGYAVGGYAVDGRAGDGHAGDGRAVEKQEGENHLGVNTSVKAFVFDMDGTILHTLPDLAIATNEALARLGYPTRSYEEILGFMGNGAQRLIESSLPAHATENERARTFALWRSIYLQSDYAHTAPFPGIVDTLHALRGAGVKTAVLSNKFDAGVQALSARFFPGLFDITRGEVPPTPRKPDPTSLLQVLDELNVPVDAAAYVGDTQVDVEVARNAGVLAIGVSWGYDTANPLKAGDLNAYIHSPEELLSLARHGHPLIGSAGRKVKSLTR